MTPPASPTPTPPDWATLPGAPAPGSLVGQLSDFAEARATMTQLDTPTQSSAAGPGTGAADSAATPSFKLLVLREGKSVRAFANRCAHFGVPLAAPPNQLIQVPLRSITCNVHYAKYRWADGSCESGECEGESLVPVPLAVNDQGQVFIAPNPAEV